MGKTEIINFIVLSSLISVVFIAGIFIFIFQYHKRKLIHEKEKALINELHIRDILHTKLEIQLQTMEDIGREIHDNVGQKLTLASIYVHQLAFEHQAAAFSERLTTVGNIVDESLRELRGLSRNLTNSDTEIGELKNLIQYECDRINALDICTIE